MTPAPATTPADLHALGRTREEIAAELGLPLRTVRRALRGLPAVHRGGTPPGRKQTEAVMLRFAPEEIAELRERAAGRPLAAWCRDVLLGRASGEEG